MESQLKETFNTISFFTEYPVNRVNTNKQDQNPFSFGHHQKLLRPVLCFYDKTPFYTSMRNTICRTTVILLGTDVQSCH